MGVPESIGQLARDADGIVQRELPLAGEPLTEGFARDTGHGEPQEPGTSMSLGDAAVEDRDDVGVLEPGGELDLAEESIRTEGSRELWAKQLERDRPIVPQVLGEPDGTHAAAAELTLEEVAVTQGFPHLTDNVAHGPGLKVETP